MNQITPGAVVKRSLGIWVNNALLFVIIALIADIPRFVHDVERAATEYIEGFYI